MKNNPYLLRRALPALSLVIWVWGGAIATADPGTHSRQLQDVGKSKDQLLAAIRDEQARGSEPEKVVSAIRELGNQKAKEAIPDLIRLLTFEDMKYKEPDEITEGFTVIGPSLIYPAAGALINIGPPSLSALVKVIEGNKTGSVESDNATYTVMIIFREDTEQGVNYLREASRYAGSQRARLRLTRATQKAEKMFNK